VTSLQAPGGFNSTAWRRLAAAVHGGGGAGEQAQGRGLDEGHVVPAGVPPLTRLSQRSMPLCLSGKRVLLMGDSQLRLMYGLFHIYLNFTSRPQFLKHILAVPRYPLGISWPR